MGLGRAIPPNHTPNHTPEPYPESYPLKKELARTVAFACDPEAIGGLTSSEEGVLSRNSVRELDMWSDARG